MLPKLDRVLLATYLRPQWPRVMLLGLLLLVTIGLQLANPQIVRTFLDLAHAGATLDRLVRIAVLFLAVMLCTQVTSIGERYLADDLGWRTTNALRADLTRHVLMLDGSFHDQHTAGQLIERVDGDVSAIADFFARFVVQVLGSIVFLAGVLVLLYLEDWRVGTLLTLFAAAAFAFMTRRGGFVGVRSRQARHAAADLSGYLEERLAGLPDLKTSGADDYVMRGLHQRMAARFHRGRAAATAGAAFSGAIGLIFVVGAGAALAVSALLYGTGAITIGTVYLVFRYTGMLREPLERLTRQMQSFHQATGGIVRVRELFATPPKVGDGPGATFGDNALSVELDGVWFAYGTDKASALPAEQTASPVLRDISCRVEPGELLGLVGRTGSGKTTIARLLFRLHDPTRGVVRLGDVDIRQARLDHLRRRIGLVTQDVQLFQATLRDNLTLFDPDVTDTRLRDVLAELGLESWLRRLDSGLDTPLGAGGRGLSAGEAQLIAMGRVFLQDPGVVVLDEAWSRLDPETERILERAVTRLLLNRTGIIIAHRLATLERVDTVLVLQDGCVAEYGRRADLAGDPGSRFGQLLHAAVQPERRAAPVEEELI